MADGRGLTHQQLYLCLDHRFLDGGGGGGGACVRWAGLVRRVIGYSPAAVSVS